MSEGGSKKGLRSVASDADQDQVKIQALGRPERESASPLMTPRFPVRDRILMAAAIAAPMLYALVVNFGALSLPPAWDSAGTVSPAALTIVDLDFDIWQVAQLPSMLYGGPSTHATSLYTIALALLIAVFGPTTGFFLAHLTSIALVGALSGATYLLARERASVALSALVAVTAGTLPVVVQQSADLYLDLPLAVVTTLACLTTLRRRFWWTAVLGFTGIWLKASAVFLLPLLLLAKTEEEKWPRHLAKSTLAGVVALVPFAVAFVTTDRFDTLVGGEREILIRSSLSLIVLTVDVFLILVTFLLVLYGRARNRSVDRMSTIVGVVVVGFVTVHLATILLSGSIALLPRYYIAVVPAVLVAAIPKSTLTDYPLGWRHAIAASLLAALALFSVVNHRGDFYPLPDHDFYVVAERSTRAQQLLQLQIEGTRRLVATGLPILVASQDYYRLGYPEMGYIDERPEVVILLTYGLPVPEKLPDSFAMLIERRYKNGLVAVERLAIEQGYRLDYEVLANGDYRSELVIATK